MPHFTDYADVQPRLTSGMLAVRNRPYSPIGAVGRGLASHVGMIVIRHADQRSVALAECREGYGARVVNFSAAIRESQGQWDIYMPRCDLSLSERAATVAFNWAGHRYDYPGILQKLVFHSPLVSPLALRLGLVPDMTDMRPSAWHDRKVCSQLYAWAYRWARAELYAEQERAAVVSGADLSWDPCPFLGDRWVEPADLVRVAEGESYRLIAKGLVIS